MSHAGSSEKAFSFALQNQFICDLAVTLFLHDNVAQVNYFRCKPDIIQNALCCHSKFQLIVVFVAT